MGRSSTPDAVSIQRATAERWNDLATLFARSDATSSCWCMWPRVRRGAMWTRSAAENRSDLGRLVQGDRATGLLAYSGDEPVGWISIGSLENYGRFEGSDGPTSTWAVVCLFVARSHRGRGVMPALAGAGIAHARAQGASTLVAIPRDWRAEDASSIARLTDHFRGVGFRDLPEGEGQFRLVMELRSSRL